MKLDLMPLWLSFNLAFWTTLILLVISFPVALFLGAGRTLIKSVIESILTLPMVLPPTVIGFYILLLLSPESFPGRIIEKYFNIRLVFSFPGILIASIIYSLPFMVQPLKNGIESIRRDLIEVSYTLGKSRLETFFRIVIPNMRTFIVTGMAMTFAHTLGEFGVVLMVGGNIPGRTKVAGMLIFESVEVLDYSTAHVYSLIMICFCSVVLISVNLLNRKKEHGKKDK
jgi:molybdate transport system permease protein